MGSMGRWVQLHRGHVVSCCVGISLYNMYSRKSPDVANTLLMGTLSINTNKNFTWKSGDEELFPPEPINYIPCVGISIFSLWHV